MAITITFPTGTATQGAPYSSSFSASGGTAPYTWAITIGAIPAGLSLNASSGAVTGTPTITAIYTFQVTVTDSTSATASGVGQISVTGGSPPPTANPVAAHTYSFSNTFLSTRTSDPPGQGGWSDSQKIYTIQRPWIGGSERGMTSFSAGALTGNPSEPRGIVGWTDDVSDNTPTLTFVGNGLPASTIQVIYPGPEPSGPIPPVSLMGLTSLYWDVSQGCFNYNGNLYLVTRPPNGADIISILKSSDGGSTWVNLDSEHRPSGFTNPLVNFSKGVIYVFDTPDGTNYQALKMDITAASPAWSAATTSTALSIDSYVENKLSGGGTVIWSNGIVPYANGDIGIFANSTISGFASAAYFLYKVSGGWQSPIAIAHGYVASTVVDPSGELTYVLYSPNGSTVTGAQINLASVTHTGSVTLLSATIPLITGKGSDGVGHGAIINNVLWVPRDDFEFPQNMVWAAQLPSPTQFLPEFLPLPPEENNGIVTWSIVPGSSGYAAGDTGTVNGNVGTNPTWYTISTVANAGGALAIALTNDGTLFTTTNYSAVDGGAQPGVGTGMVIQVTSVNGVTGAITGFNITSQGHGYALGDTGSFLQGGAGTNATYIVGSVGVAGQVLTLQLNNGGGYSLGNQSTSTGGPQPGGGTGLVLDILSVGAPNPSCAYMVFPNGTVTSISLACPVNTAIKIGTFYSGQLIVTGGTFPYTFAILSGALPPGLILNASTGVISGTPTTSGSYSYTAEVTDANGLTATVTCMFSVAPPGPPAPPPPPAMCIINPIATFNPTLVSYNEPDELSGT